MVRAFCYCTKVIDSKFQLIYRLFRFLIDSRTFTKYYQWIT